MRIIVMVTVMLLGASVDAAREPRWPLKDRRTLYTDQQIAQARRNVERFESAKKVADAIIRRADEWAAWSDEELIELITDARVPRAFDVGTTGCPKCGHEISEKFGGYPWIIDPKIPFKVKCPNDGSVYPSNDYATYYRSGLVEKVDWDTEFVDDGWGWVGPDGEKHWFVAYWNHWMWHGRLVPGLRALGRAYLLTGDERYAHKAAVIIHRIAEVYPEMDHAPQSRYGTMMAARGIDYSGKVVNRIWETALVQQVTEAYDAIWEMIDSNTELQRLVGKTGQEIRAFIEANFLEDAIDAYFAGKLRGNFGMHQYSLMMLGLVRQHGEQDKWFDALLDESSHVASLLGLRFALYNLISRDGIPFENAPGYNMLWVRKISEYGELLAQTGRDVFVLPRTKRLYDGVLDQIVVQQFTPCIGDSGSVWGDLTGRDAATFQTAYRKYRDPRYARWLAQFGAAGEAGFRSFDSLMHEPIDGEGPVGSQESRLLDGFGQAILNNPGDTVALSMFHGLKAGHGHFDRLNIDVFANGAPVMPDLGYPDAMNDFVKGIYTWSKNTISHNTVTVDASRQAENVPGTVHLFADSPFARVIEVDAAGTYPQCKMYRRAVIMIDVDERRSYFVDVFTVVGGQQHDYSLHGPPGEFEMIGGEWSDPEPGTLAGADVPLGYIYDQPEMEAPGYSGGFGGYRGSGFQHLFNVRRGSGDWVAQWQHQNVPGAKLRIRMLPDPLQEVLLCDACVSPIKHPQILRYLIARRQGDDLMSRFVSVIEPFSDEPFIKSVSLAPIVRPIVGLIIEREDGLRDRVIYDPYASHVSVITLDRENREVRKFTAGGADLRGAVIAVDPANLRVRVKLDPPSRYDAASLVGRVVHFENKLRRTAHTVGDASLDDDVLTLTMQDDLLVGRARLDAVETEHLATRTSMPLAPLYPGTTLSSDDYAFTHPVRVVESGQIQLAEPLPADHPLKPGDNVWIVNVGTTDRFEAPAITYWEAAK